MKKLLIVGGDRRFQRLSELLRQDGYLVQTLGLFAEEKADVAEADAVLFPYPYAVRNGKIPTLNGLSLTPESVLDQAKSNALILSGKGLEPYALSWDVMPKCFRVKKYAHVERFAQENAELSAEAAVYEVMQRSEKAVKDLTLMVLGYGLFGREMAKRLLALGAEVFVAARRMEARELAAQDGMHALSFQTLGEMLPQVDMALNTVPAQVLSEETLRRFKAGTWLLELASAPYGFDREIAETIGLRCALLPGLPARYAPVSAAGALKDAVVALLEEGLQK